VGAADVLLQTVLVLGHDLGVHLLLVLGVVVVGLIGGALVEAVASAMKELVTPGHTVATMDLVATHNGNNSNDIDNGPVVVAGGVAAVVADGGGVEAVGVAQSASVGVAVETAAVEAGLALGVGRDGQNQSCKRLREREVLLFLSSSFSMPKLLTRTFMMEQAWLSSET